MTTLKILNINDQCMQSFWNTFWHQIKLPVQQINNTKTIQKEKTVCQSKQFVKDWMWRVSWTGSMRRSGLAGPPGASPRWFSPSKHCRFTFTSGGRGNLLDQRSGFIVIATLVGFVLFYLSHVLWPSIALAWLSLGGGSTGWLTVD